MFYEEAVAMRPSADRTAALANALLGSLDAREPAAILERLYVIFNVFAAAIGYRRELRAFGSLCCRYLWTPIAGGSGRMLTDIDFISDPRLTALPAYQELLKTVSRNRTEIAEGLLICLLIARDWENGDLWSIQNAEAHFASVQLAATIESANRRLRVREGGRNKSLADRNRRNHTAARVRKARESASRAGYNAAETWRFVQSQVLPDDGYPSPRTLRRLFDEENAKRAPDS